MSINHNFTPKDLIFSNFRGGGGGGGRAPGAPPLDPPPLLAMICINNITTKVNKTLGFLRQKHEKLYK